MKRDFLTKGLGPPEQVVCEDIQRDPAQNRSAAQGSAVPNIFFYPCGGDSISTQWFCEDIQRDPAQNRSASTGSCL